MGSVSCTVNTCLDVPAQSKLRVRLYGSLNDTGSFDLFASSMGHTEAIDCMLHAKL